MGGWALAFVNTVLLNGNNIHVQIGNLGHIKSSVTN